MRWPAEPAGRVPELGPWRIRRAGTTAWRKIDVPGCWEEAGFGKSDPGPFDYETLVRVPPSGSDRAFVHFGAVSYACTVFVDDDPVGSHTGMWDPFELDVTAAVRRSEFRLRVRVEKPASLTAGPDSPPVAGNHPVRQTLAGFLPYVWGHSHGGIWQPVTLRSGPEFSAYGATPDRIAAESAAPGRVEVFDRRGDPVAQQEINGRAEIRIPDAEPWSPQDPALYRVRCNGSEQFVGLRELRAEGSRMSLNGRPLYPRMVLSWGWYPDRLCPDPGPARVRRDLEQLRQLGFNGVKLCLWFPPPYYFDIADELGMLLWLELPMWLPEPTPEFTRQVLAETERLVRLARRHPSVVLYTLGCELDSAVGADLLEPLYRGVTELAGDALVCDNSGSGEAYGGIADSFADFYDHHLYCDLQYFPQTLEHFAPGWREPKPWLFGEFCDLDTFRDLRSFPEPPWWTSRDPAVNPQGARWQFDAPDMQERLRSNGFWDRGEELVRISARQALLHRKITLEAVRARSDTSGYVITGERDTPISTAGLWDDHGVLKVDPARFRSFNADRVLVPAWGRRRDWIAGGDRPAPFDTWTYHAGERVRMHVLLADHSGETYRGPAEWRVDIDGTVVADGILPKTPGTAIGELGTVDFAVPAVNRPVQALLQVHAEGAANSWPLWLLPPRQPLPPCAVYDPAARLGSVDAAGTPFSGDVLVTTRWNGEIDAWIRSGGRAVLIADPGTEAPFRLSARPFWREAVKVIEPHQAWGDFPHAGWTDLQFAGCASDHALMLDGSFRPLLRRVDARTAEVSDYAAESDHGSGRLLVTSLNLAGGQGNQPLGLQRNTAARYLLSQWIGWLSDPFKPALPPAP